MSKNLYKAKRLDDGLWVEGYYLKKIDPLLGTESSFILNQGDLCSFFSWNKVDPETVCQCTGKKDKNGKKIFEDDVCMCPYIDTKVHFHGNKPEICRIEFYDGMFIARWDNERICKLSTLLNDLEVIGNIHDKEYGVNYGMDQC